MKRKTGDFTTNSQIFRLSAAAIIIGAVCALIAIVLLKAIGLITNVLFYHRYSWAFTTPTNNHLGAWVIILPALGGLVIGLIARFGSEKIRGHGIPEAIEAMLVNQSKVQPKVAFWKPISAAISIGTGGPFGAEGPIIMTGGSFGSLLAQFLHFSSIERRILLVAGAAGGMSATFAAPMSSVLFAVELLVFEFKPRSLVPIALASAVADVIRISLIGPGPMFGMPNLAHVSWQLTGVSVVIGLVGSVLAMLLTWAIYAVEDGFRKLPIHWMWWPALGGLIVGVGGYISPRALGVGYDSIRAMLNGNLVLSMLVGLLLAKTIVWVIALGSGTSGGILAPILIIGGSLGEVAGKLCHATHPGMWALLGMSAIFAGVTRTPFTSVVFPLELTHNLGALLPLLITSSIATGLSAYILPRSILTERIARRGLHMTREYSTDPFHMHYVRELVYKPEPSLEGRMRLQEAADQLLKADEPAHTWLSVVSTENRWLGVIHLSDILKMVHQSPDGCILDCLQEVPVVRSTDPVKSALSTLVVEGADWARVVDEDDVVLGAVTVERFLALRLDEWESEEDRQRVFSLPINRDKSHFESMHDGGGPGTPHSMGL